MEQKIEKVKIEDVKDEARNVSTVFRKRFTFPSAQK